MHDQYLPATLKNQQRVYRAYIILIQRSLTNHKLAVAAPSPVFPYREIHNNLFTSPYIQVEGT